jgi:hypothetical protein
MKTVSCVGSLELSATTASKSLADHFRRQLRLRQLHPVLRLHLRDVDVRADLERKPDADVPVVRAGGIVIQEIVDAGELHFDGARHRIGHDLRAGARIIGFDLDDGRTDIRELRDGEGRERRQPDDDDDDREDGGEDRSLDEKSRAHFAPLEASGLASST